MATPPTVTVNGDALAVRPFSDLSDTGLLWLINTTVFHPRGFGLALVTDDDSGEVTGWALVGRGTEAMTFRDADAVANFHAAEATLSGG